MNPKIGPTAGIGFKTPPLAVKNQQSPSHQPSNFLKYFSFQSNLLYREDSITQNPK